MIVTSKLLNDPENYIKFSEFFLKMGEFQKKYDHPRIASDCFITSKTLLYWAKVALKGHKK